MDHEIQPESMVETETAMLHTQGLQFKYSAGVCTCNNVTVHVPELACCNGFTSAACQQDHLAVQPGLVRPCV